MLGVRILAKIFGVKKYGESEKNIFKIFWILKMDSRAFWILKIWFFWNIKLETCFWGKKMCWSRWNMWRGFKKMLSLLNLGFSIQKYDFFDQRIKNVGSGGIDYGESNEIFFGDSEVHLASESRILKPFYQKWSPLFV